MAGRRSGHAGHARTQQTRRRIAVEAARLITENGVRDYRQAKLKAAERLGVFDETELPKNREIEDALREYQRLFLGAEQERVLRRLREVAREAMRYFARHEPRLVGAVLEGTADLHSAVCLHLHTDDPQQVELELRERGIPYEAQTRRLRLDRETSRDFPVVLFGAGDAALDVTLLPYDLLRQAPLDRVSEKPMRRAALPAVEALLAEAHPTPP